MKIAIIPVKVSSERVARKNFRAFTDKGASLLDLKIDQIKASGVYDRIYISTDADFLTHTAEDGVELRIVSRDSYYCNNVTSWSEVISHILDSINEPPESIISWCHVTSPLFNRYAEAMSAYESSLDRGFDSLVTVKKVNEFLLWESGIPINYQWGAWHKYSQDLPSVLAVTGALFTSTLGMMSETRYVIGKNPLPFMTAGPEVVDVDTEEDFNEAKQLHDLG